VVEEEEEEEQEGEGEEGEEEEEEGGKGMMRRRWGRIHRQVRVRTCRWN
jgi:hypothetical protein